MPQDKSALINLSQIVLQVSLKTMAAIGSAAGLPWLAGLTALPDALAASEALRTALEQHAPIQVDLPAPAFWTHSTEAWQQVCSSVEQQLPAILDQVAVTLSTEPVPTDALVQTLLLHAIGEALPPWEIPAQERGLVAVYLARHLFTKAAEELAPVLTPLRSNALLDMTANVLDLLKRAQAVTPAHVNPNIEREISVEIRETKRSSRPCDPPAELCRNLPLNGSPAFLVLNLSRLGS